MKDAHLFAALERAVQRYGSSELPEDPSAAASRGCRAKGRSRRRTPGWVSIREIEACQPPNTYPRIHRREIKVRCAQLARAEGGPVLEMRTAGLRTWVRFAPAKVGIDDLDGPGASDESDLTRDGSVVDPEGQGASSPVTPAA